MSKFSFSSNLPAFIPGGGFEPPKTQPVKKEPEPEPEVLPEEDIPENFDDVDDVDDGEINLQSNIENPVDNKRNETLHKLDEIAERFQSLDVDDDVDDEPEEEILIDPETLGEDPREHINVVFIGHVDAGKSTLSGQILYQTGMIDRRTIEKYEREAAEHNRGSWYFAFILDTFEEERAKGKTVEVGRAHFSTTNKRYTILDAPGHRVFVPNMIIGVSQADVAVLVISARKGEYEAGFTRDGQTREHAIIAKTLGVKKLVVVVNKMDDESVGWSKERYDEIQGQVIPFLRTVGWNPKDVSWMPLSGYTGANLKDPIPEGACPWWTGGTFLELLDSLQPLDRLDEGPLRIPILDKIKEKGHVIIMGKVESGIVCVGDTLTIMPGRTNFNVALIENDDGPLRRARPGEIIRILVKASQINEDHIHPGYVLSFPDNSPTVTEDFVAQIFIMNLLEHKSVFSAGYEAVLHIHTCVQEVQCMLLIESLDPKTGESLTRLPKYIGNKGIVIAHLKSSRPLCIEKYSDFPQLGRFTLRDEGRTIAFGKILATNAPQMRRKQRN